MALFGSINGRGEMRKSLLSSSICAVLVAAALGCAAPAMAGNSGEGADQDRPSGQVQTASAEKKDSPTELGEVQVMGVRASLKQSIADKRESDQVIDTISAQDVGQFPTRNIADALQRITGVQMDRNFGEGSTIKLRGLPSNMIMNMYDGRQLPSPTGSRDLDYSILPVDFVRTLAIYKTPTADMPQAGLAGTVNVEPVKALDLPGRTAAFNVGTVYDGNSKRAKPDVSAFYADKFLDNTLGMAVGAAITRREISRNGFSDFMFEPRDVSALTGDRTQTGQYRLWHYTSLGEEFGTRKRKSFVANAQWRPNESFEFHGDFIFSGMNTEDLTTGSAARFTNALTTGASGPFHNIQLDSNKNIISADVDNVWLLNTARDDQNRQWLRTGSLGGKWTPNERWTVDFGASRGTAAQKESNFSLEGSAYTGVHYDFTRDPTFASWNFTDPKFNPLDPNNFYFDHINGSYDQAQYNDTHEGHVNVKFDVSSGVLKSIQFGGNSVANSFYSNGYSLYVSGPKGLAALSALTGLPIVQNAYPDGRSAISAAPFMSPSPFTGNPLPTYSGPAQFPRSYLWSDPRKFFAKYSLAQLLAAAPGSVTRSPSQDSRVDEKVKGAYFRIDLGSDDNRWSANLGARYEKTGEGSRFFSTDFSKVLYNPTSACDQICAQANRTLDPSILANVNNDYSQWLPSANFKYSINEDWILRLGASKEMTRPDLGQLMGGLSVQMLQTPPGGTPIATINSGNPNLKPYLANAFDASLEWYFGPEALVSAAFFYKDVSNWVFTSQINETHTINLTTGGTKDYVFLRTLPQNGGGVKIKGLELSYQQPFTFLPAPWDGFGVTANYTFVDASDITNKATGDVVPVTGVSKNSYNASFYYEKPKFSVRLSYNFHEGRLESVRDYWSVTPVYSKDYGQWDLSAGYRINDWAQATFSVTNLLNKAGNIQYAQIGGYINQWYQEGRIAQLGIHVKF